MDAEEWGAALRLARARGVDPDDVHKARWEASTPSREALTDSWAKISDRAWAAAKCAVAVAPTYEAQRVVLARGLRETEKHIRDDDADETDVDDESNRGDLRGTSPPSREWCWWTRLRLTLLAQLDRLDTLHAAHLGNYSPRAYASFRSADLGDATIAFAAAGNHIAAERVARRHPRAVAPRLLDVLEALPETTSPAHYAGLLPWSSPWRDSAAPTPARGARGADRCETRDAVHALLAESRGEGRTVAELAARAGVSAAAAAVSAATPPAAWVARATEPLVALDEAWRVAAEEEEGGAAGWARRRAARCDEEAGAIGAAAELLAAAAAAFHDDASLGAAARAAAELASAVYEADPPNPRTPPPGHPVSSDALVSAGEGRTVHPKTEPPSCHLVAVSSLWSASLAGYVDASASSRFAALMADAATRPESVDAALDAAAVRRVLSSDGGGDAFASWLAAVVAADRPDVAAAAIRRAGEGEGAPEGTDEAWDALGGAKGLAAAAAAAVEGCPAGDAPTAAALAAMMTALPPTAANEPVARRATAVAVACRALARRGDAAVPAAVAAAAKDANASRELARRVAARARARRPREGSARGVPRRGRARCGRISRRSRGRTARSPNTSRAKTPPPNS